jgi:hypothetical protein
VLFGVLKTEQVRFEYFEAILIKVNALRDWGLRIKCNKVGKSVCRAVCSGEFKD